MLEPVVGFFDAMLREDLKAPQKQRHTIDRIWQRLAVEHSGKAVHRACADASQGAPLPADGRHDCGIDPTPTVQRNSRFMVRQCYHWVPARCIGTQVRAKLRANELLVDDGRHVVARHPRLIRRYTYHDVLDHSLEVLLVTPRVFAGTAALALSPAESGFIALASRPASSAARSASAAGPGQVRPAPQAGDQHGHEEGHEHLSPAKTVPATEDTEAGAENQVPPRQMPLPETSPEDTMTDDACRGLRLPIIRERFEELERRATAAASNALFSEWDHMCIDARPCPAIAERLAFQGTLVPTGTDSYRLKATETEHQATRRT
ncbi:hypothetical protein [Streptomyces albospinus]|uniref:hypothetical protein n=1 Tax=Streptomyces albospinus TaxID=285515 RepID=UPI00166F6BE5|nr:hypothetical protein [Streptomyces albospinus]